MRAICLEILVLGNLSRLHAQSHVRIGLRRELVGCYELFAGTGKPVDSSFYRASPRVRLDSAINPFFTTHKEFGAHRFLRRLDINGHHLDASFGNHPLVPMWWADSLSDSVYLSFTDGFSGAFLTLDAMSGGADTLRGHIQVHWDFQSPTGQGPAYAVRVGCVE